MEEFDVLLTDISRVNIEITRTKTMKVWHQELTKEQYFPSILIIKVKKPEISPKYCLK